jgi:hypothetical protein
MAGSRSALAFDRARGFRPFGMGLDERFAGFERRAVMGNPL